MKTDLGKIWYETDERGVWKVGFTRRYIEQKLGECFHVMQADIKQAQVGLPLLVLETNDGIERIKSPVTGTVLEFNARARDFPDRLTDEETIVQILPKGVTLPKVETKKSKSVDTIPLDFNERIWNDLTQAAQAVPQPGQPVRIWEDFQQAVAPPPPPITRGINEGIHQQLNRRREEVERLQQTAQRGATRRRNNPNNNGGR